MHCGKRFEYARCMGGTVNLDVIADHGNLDASALEGELVCAVRLLMAAAAPPRRLCHWWQKRSSKVGLSRSWRLRRFVQVKHIVVVGKILIGDVCADSAPPS